MIYKQKYEGLQAREYLPYTIGDDSTTVISPVLDTILDNEKLGHLIIFKDSSFDKRGGLYYQKPLTDNQKKNYINGSFVFIGTNAKYFHHLINNIITGKYTSSYVLIDERFSNLVSKDFIKIIEEFVIDHV